MSKTEKTYERILRYLSDQLSGRERHHLEKEMMQDAFDEEAFEGLNTLKAEDLESDLIKMGKRLDKNIQYKKVSHFPVLKFAAALVLLLGLAAVIIIVVKVPEEHTITQELKRQVIQTPKQISIEKQKLAEEQTEENRIARSEKESVQSDAGRTVSASEDEQEASGQELSLAPSLAETDQIQTDAEMMVSEESIVSAPTLSESSAKRSAKMDYGTERSQETRIAEESGFYITGKVVGIDSHALAGTSIREKGSKTGTMSDMNGNFRLLVKNSDSKLTLSRLGYETTVLPTETSKKGGQLQLSEVIMLGYNEGDNLAKPKAAGITELKDSVSFFESPYQYSRAIPPMGSIRNFERWIENRLDLEKLRDLEAGFYKVYVKVKIARDGTVSNVQIENSVPAEVANEYRRVIMQSEKWMPALKETLPVEDEIMMTFSILVKEQNPFTQ